MGIRTCPRCSEPLHHGHVACPVCAFSLEVVDAIFGSRRVRLQRLVDASKKISPEHAAQLNTRLDRFERDFPQLVFITYIADLPDNLDLRQLGFWLINRAIIESPRGNDHAILLAIDNRQISASLSLGYFPEQHLGEDTLAAILDRLRPHLAARQYAAAIASCLNSLFQYLRQSADRSTQPRP